MNNSSEIGSDDANPNKRNSLYTADSIYTHVSVKTFTTDQAIVWKDGITLKSKFIYSHIFFFLAK